MLPATIGVMERRLALILFGGAVGLGFWLLAAGILWAWLVGWSPPGFVLFCVWVLMFCDWAVVRPVRAFVRFVGLCLGAAGVVLNAKANNGRNPSK